MKNKLWSSFKSTWTETSTRNSSASKLKWPTSLQKSSTPATTAPTPGRSWTRCAMRLWSRPLSNLRQSRASEATSLNSTTRSWNPSGRPKFLLTIRTFFRSWQWRASPMCLTTPTSRTTTWNLSGSLASVRTRNCLANRTTQSKKHATSPYSNIEFLMLNLATRDSKGGWKASRTLSSTTKNTSGHTLMRPELNCSSSLNRNAICTDAWKRKLESVKFSTTATPGNSKASKLLSQRPRGLTEASTKSMKTTCKTPLDLQTSTPRQCCKTSTGVQWCSRMPSKCKSSYDSSKTTF